MKQNPIASHNRFVRHFALPVLLSSIALVPIPNIPAACFVALMVLLFGHKRRRKATRVNEKKADRAAQAEEQTSGDYARALLALHEPYLLPATNLKNSTHPSAYDRAIKAGLTPDFPKPRPPSIAVIPWISVADLLILFTVCYMCLGGKILG